MNFKVPLLCFLFLLLQSNENNAHIITTSIFHAFHVSKCDIEYKNKSLQITLHLFIDDIERALDKQKDCEKSFVGTEKEKKIANTCLENYLRDKLQFKINDQAIYYQFLGKETAKDKTAIWCYLEVSNINNLKNITVSNKILTELFSDQKNMVSIFMDKGLGNKYFLFDKNKFSETATFN